MSTPTSSSPSPSNPKRRSNTTPAQIKAMITFLEDNKPYFDVVIRKNPANLSSSEKQVNKKEVYDAMFISLNQKGLIPGWTPDLMKSRLSRLLTKFNETYEASTSAGFGLTNKDTKKGITTIAEKLELLCPGYERLLALHGKQPVIRPYRVSFHGDPSGPIYANPADLPSAESSTPEPSIVEPSSTTFINSTPATVNQITTDRPRVQPSYLSACRITADRPRITPETASKKRVDDDCSSDFSSEYRKAQRQRYLTEDIISRRKHRLDMLQITMRALQKKTFGDASWRKVTKIVIAMDKMLSEEPDLLAVENSVSSAEENEESSAAENEEDSVMENEEDSVVENEGGSLVENEGGSLVEAEEFSTAGSENDSVVTEKKHYF